MSDDISKMTVAQLKEYAAEHGITIPGSAKKAEIVEAIQAVVGMPAEAPEEATAESVEEPAEAPEEAPEPAPEPPIEADDVDEDTAFPGVTLDHEVGEEDLADGTTCYLVHKDDLFLAARSIRDQGYHLLSCLSASDDKKGPMHVFYSFLKPAGSPAEFGEKRIKVTIPKADEAGTPVRTDVVSLTDIYPAAAWHEREMYDMYGIHFDGHPDLRRMFLPEGWKGFPMRKDYAEGEQFVAMQEGEDIVLAEHEEGSW